MKSFTIVCLLAAVAGALAGKKAHSRGCIYSNGRCSWECEKGTHSVSTGCGPVTPEATCDKPNPVQSKGLICDYSACYCDPPTVRDTVSKKCVPLNECPKKE